MAKVYTTALELIGNTPLLKLEKLEKKLSLNANIYAKVEAFNLTGSVKDRIALSMALDAKEKGLINENSVIIEPTSGNTGIGISAIATLLGVKAIVVMPETMSVERRSLIAMYGAEIVLTEGKLGMKGAIAKAEELRKDNPNAITLGQFVNSANPQAHYEHTGPEIYDALSGKVDVFVAGVGTGGTITGAGHFFKEKNKNTKVVAVEPENSPVLSKGTAGAHKIQGIGAGFVPEVLDTKVYDEIITVKDSDAYDTVRKLASTEAVFVGASSGAALWAAIEEAKKSENKGKNIVVVLPDSGDRYLSMLSSN